MPVRRPSKILLALCASGLLLAAAIPILRIRHTVSQTAREAAAGSQLAFSLGPLVLSPNPGFEPLVAQTRFAAAAVLEGSIYLDGPTGLTRYNSGGAVERSFRVGLDLPGAPLGRMLVARLRGDSHPQLLIATAGAGVLLFDPHGSSFRQLLPADEGLRDITALSALASGDLLLGTRRHGVLLYDGASLEVYRPEYRDLAITTMLGVGDDLWVGTEEQGLYVTHAGVTRHFTSELPDLHVESLAFGADRVFAGTPVGVAEFDRTESDRPARTLAPGIFAHTLFVSGDTLTIGSLDQGIVDVPLTSAQGRPRLLPVDSDSSRTEELLQLAGDLYAVRADGLYRRRGAGWSSILSAGRAVLADDNVAALNFAPDGRLWIGYFDRGLDILDVGANSARHIEDDALFCINRIVLDPRRQTMAVATANGLVLFDRAGSPRQVLGRRDGLISDHINDVVYSGDEMTVATPAGLSFIRDSGVESLYAFEGLVNNHVYALAVSGDRLLAGTLGGLSVLDQDAVRSNLTVANSGLRHNWITAVVADGDGGYMVGTYGAGVMRLSSVTSRFEPMDLATRAMVVNPNAMLATAGHIYAGSLGQGLWSYGRGSNRWTQITAGLPSLNVTALAARDGMVYVGTENGLVRIAEARLGR
jgi:ligand-binding sensor domain-containing protein